MAQLGMVLDQYADEVVEYVSSPLTGVQRKSEFPPTIAKIVTACDDYAERVERRNKPRRDVLPKAPVPLLRELPQGSLAQVFVPEEHHRYADLVAWAENAQPVWWRYGNASDGRRGIWVSHDAWNNSAARRLASSTQNEDAA